MFETIKNALGFSSPAPETPSYSAPSTVGGPYAPTGARRRRTRRGRKGSKKRRSGRKSNRS